MLDFQMHDCQFLTLFFFLSWRVIERSDVVVQIVDARNPLLFRCQDLERYVSEIDSSKKQLLLVNKADFLSDHMRKCWADHFESIGVRYAFCSAMIDNSRIREEKEKAQEESPYESDEKETKIPVTIARKKEYFDRYRILATYEVMDLFRSIYFDFDDSKDDNRSIVVGLVGYPNVGKSSTINALCGEKRVGVAAMPGKTRHFQTIVLGNLTLCDCPGLVFPTFMNTKAGLICNGILPIDRMRDCIGPVQWLCNRVAGKQLEETYSIKLNGKERGLSAHHVLEEYARMRGFMAASGRPDEARGSRVILKDFNKGKILYCHPPPNLSEEQREYFFNSMEKTSIIHLTEEETAENERRELTNDNIMHQMLKKDHGSSSGPVEHSGMAGKKLSRREKARAKANAKKGMELGQKYRRTQQIGGYEIEE